MKLTLSLLLLSLLFGLISACDQEEASQTTEINPTNVEQAIGTDIKDVIQKSSADVPTEAIKTLTWEDLIPNDYDPEQILTKYEELFSSIEEGSVEEQALLEKLDAEFDNAPSNQALDGTTVKIPGFVSPLDTQDNMISEFLLVPYFGSCIHSPPPPVNQTVLVIPQIDKSIPIEKIYEPVWVIGRIAVERKETELAQAGYVIQDAELQIY